MALQKVEEYLNGIVVMKPQKFVDDRGFFMETFQQESLHELGIDIDIKQENHSCSALGVIRGMHFQWDKPMGKLLRVIAGKILLVEVDIRHHSPTLGKHCSIEVSAQNNHIVWIPPGFANGFIALEHNTELEYKCTALYNPKAEGAIAWNDPALGIEWPVHIIDTEPIISQKDMHAMSLAEWLQMPESQAFTY